MVDGVRLRVRWLFKKLYVYAMTLNRSHRLLHDAKIPKIESMIRLVRVFVPTLLNNSN